jgi:carbonyl reductase 1
MLYLSDRNVINHFPLLPFNVVRITPGASSTLVELRHLLNKDTTYDYTRHKTQESTSNDMNMSVGSHRNATGSRVAVVVVASFILSAPLRFVSGAVSSTQAGRVAVVTGANKGIGYHIALQLGKSGLFETIVLGCRDSTRGVEAVSALQRAVTGKEEGLASSCASVNYTTFPLTLGNSESHSEFVQYLNENHAGKCHLLINNAAMAFKGSDPTPFPAQTKPTLDVNFRGTVDLTEKMLPLLRKSAATGFSRIVNVASMAGALRQVSPQLQSQFTDKALTIDQLQSLMDEFENDVQSGVHKSKGWSNSNYGMSKLAVQAATKIWAREEESNNVLVYSCCPGYCKTDMSSNFGPRDPADGARNAVIPATAEPPLPTGSYIANDAVATW